MFGVRLKDTDRGGNRVRLSVRSPLSTWIHSTYFSRLSKFTGSGWGLRLSKRALGGAGQGFGQYYPVCRYCTCSYGKHATS